MLIVSVSFYLISFFLALVSYYSKLSKRFILIPIFIAIASYLYYVSKISLHIGGFPFANIYGFVSLLGNIVISILILMSYKNQEILRFSAILSFFGLLFTLLVLSSELSIYKNPLYSLHAVSALFAYVSAFLGSIAAFLRLFFEKRLKHKDFPSFHMPINLLRTMERLLINSSFVAFTLTLIFGSLWTRVHFGKHWINDPKLLTTLILWVYYALVVHANLIRGLKPRQLSFLILFGGFLSLLNLLFVRHEV